MQAINFVKRKLEEVIQKQEETDVQYHKKYSELQDMNHKIKVLKEFEKNVYSS